MKVGAKVMFLKTRTFQESTVQLVELPVRIFTLKNNVYAIPVLSGKNIICKM